MKFSRNPPVSKHLCYIEDILKLKLLDIIICLKSKSQVKNLYSEKSLKNFTNLFPIPHVPKLELKYVFRETLKEFLNWLI